MRNFKQAQHSFHGSNASFVIPYLANSTFRGYAVGDLAFDVASRLLNAGAAYKSLFGRMRLVNVGSTYTGFAYGTIDVGDATPNVSHLVFTFAVGRRASFVDLRKLHKRPLNNNVVIYGDAVDGVQFISVGINSVNVSSFGITNLQPRALKYLYLTAGVILRSIFRRHVNHRLSREEVESYHERLSKLTVPQLPIGNVFEIPYQRWIWQRSVWKLCPNLIASQCLNPWSAARALDMLPIANIDYRNALHPVIWDEGEDTLFDMLERSLIRFVAAINSQSTALPDQTGLLFPALLYSVLYDNRVGFDADIELHYAWLVQHMGEQDTTDLFQPYGLTVRRLMDGNVKFER